MGRDMSKSGSHPHALKTHIEKWGWRSLDERLWQKWESVWPNTVFIAPPLDTIPSPEGNAIYSLVETLVERLPDSTLILARWPEQGEPQPCAISDRILYDTNPLQPGWLEKRLPYRLKKNLWGMSAPFHLNYARRAAQVCQLLKVKTIIIEDIPMFAPAVRNVVGSNSVVFLHQHASAPLSTPHHSWLKVQESLNGMIFVAEQAPTLTENRHGQLSIPDYVIYNGVDRSHYDRISWEKQGQILRQQLGIGSEEKVLLYAGRITPGKGVAEAALAFNQAEVANSHLVVVGNVAGDIFHPVPEYSQRLCEAAEQSGGCIHLRGTVPQAELPAYYAAADVVIVPSLGHEGLPKVITEALAMQCPCIVTRRGGALELIEAGWNGWVVPEPVTIESLATTIRQALAEYPQMSPAPSRVDLSLEAMASHFEAVLQSAPASSRQKN